MSDWTWAIITMLAVWIVYGVLWARMAYKHPRAMNRKALANARALHWWAIPGCAAMYPWTVLGNAIEARVHREWHCEGEAVGCYEHGICSPDHEIHNPPCGWRS